MSSYVIILTVLNALLTSPDAMSVIRQEASEVMVGADAKVMLNANSGTPDKTEKLEQDKTQSDEDPKTLATADDKLTGPVSISLYYETRCPDCILFINQSLAPLWANEDLREHLNITINPYGNSMSIPVSKVSDGYKFFHPDTTGDGWDYVHMCQHGSDECLGNLIQACAIEKVEQKKYMDLIICMASEPSWGIEKLGFECMTKAGIDPNPIKECVTSPHGNTLMAEFGKKTQEVPNRLGTPWVMVGGVNLQNVTDLLRTTCHGLSGLTNGPKSCDPFKNDKIAAAPAPANHDDDFTVLPVISEKKTLVTLPTDI